MAKKSIKTPGIIRVTPLGGLGEIGKNMMIIEYVANSVHDSIIIDAGIMFPTSDMLGVDYIIPDYKYIMDKLDTIRGVIITHGHEDHTGAIAHLMEHVRAPVYATPLTCGLLELKLKGAKIHDQVVMETILAGETYQMGVFTIEFFHVTHSIPDCVGMGITTPVGLLVHTGDFKLDPTPVDNWPTDLEKLAEFAERGVLALFSDSTNALEPGWTPSERTIDEGFERVFQQAKGRIIIATFASLVSRIQQIVNVAQRFGRKIAVTGFSMIQTVRMARELGYLELHDSMMIEIEQAAQMGPSQVVILTTGTQGEPSAGLSRLAMGKHRDLEVMADDTVVLSSHAIPGNTEWVNRTINKLLQQGANVIYDPIELVHVSGHGSQEELKHMIETVRPRFFVPVHGELRMLHMHKRLATDLGIPPENIIVVENGYQIDITPVGISVGQRVPGGYVFVDGSGVGDIGPEVMRDREILGRHGFVIANITMTRDTRQLIGDPEIISRGFVFMKEAQDLVEGAQDTINDLVYHNGFSSPRDLRRQVERALDKFFYKETRRRPMIFAFVTEV